MTNINVDPIMKDIKTEGTWRLQGSDVPFTEARVYKTDGTFYVTRGGDDTIDLTNQSYVTSKVSISHDLFFHSFEHCSYRHFCRFMENRYEEILAEVATMIIAGYSKDRISTYYLDYFELSANTLYDNKVMTHREFLHAMRTMTGFWEKLVRVCEFEVYDESDCND